MSSDKNKPDDLLPTTKGRFPANIILDEEAGRVMDESAGNVKAGGNLRGNEPSPPFNNCYGEMDGRRNFQSYSDNGGPSRFFYCPKASRGERNRGLEGMEEKELWTMSGGELHPDKSGNSHNTTGCINRTIVKNNHPTVKPIALFEWLIKLVTREGQIILDPFLGSGTTAIAAHKAGRECIGIEREDEYVEIAKRWIDHWESQPQQGELQEAGNV